MAKCPDILKFRVGSPERQAAIDCQMGRVQTKLRKQKIKGGMVKRPAPPQGVNGNNPLKAAIDTFKGDSWRTQ